MGEQDGQQAGNEQGNENRSIPDQKPSEGGGVPGAGEQVKPGEGEAKQPTVEDRLAAIEAENVELRKVSTGAVRRAQEAEQFVNTLTDRLQQVANRGGAAPGGGAPPNEEEVRQRLRERIAEDPASVLDEHYRTRTGPLVQGFLEQQGRTNRELFVTRLSASPEGKELITDYMEDVDAFLKDFGPEHRASADAYDAALRWVRAKPDNLTKEIQKGIRREREKEKTHFVEAGTAGERGPKTQQRSLSDIEKQVAKGLGLSDEEYMKYKEE